MLVSAVQQHESATSIHVSLPLTPAAFHPSLSSQSTKLSSLCYTAGFCSIQFGSVAQSCPTLCDPMDCSTPGLPVHHQLPEFTQTNVMMAWLMSSSHLILCSTFFSRLQSFQMCQFFAAGDQSIGVSASASVLPMNIQDWFPLGSLVGLPCHPRDSQESSPTPQFKSINSSVLSSHIHT